MRKIKNEELGRKSVDAFRQAQKLPVVLVLDNVRSLNNVGSIFRTADAFLCEAIYLCGITAQPPHREIEKTALGATESVSWKYFPSTLNAITELKEEGYTVVAIEQADEGIFLDDFKTETKRKYALVFGHEMHGVSDEVMARMDAAIEVPQQGTKHSLNIAVCAGIVVWEFCKQMQKEIFKK